MNIVEVLSGDWWDGPWAGPDPPKPAPALTSPRRNDAVRVVLHLVREVCDTHPHFVIRPDEHAALDYLSGWTGAEWKSQPTTNP